jgi:hypothetical protein
LWNLGRLGRRVHPVLIPRYLAHPDHKAQPVRTQPCLVPRVRQVQRPRCLARLVRRATRAILVVRGLPVRHLQCLGRRVRQGLTQQCLGRKVIKVTLGRLVQPGQPPPCQGHKARLARHQRFPVRKARQVRLEPPVQLQRYLGRKAFKASPVRRACRVRPAWCRPPSSMRLTPKAPPLPRP